MDGLDELWADLLSAEAARIRRAWNGLSAEERLASLHATYEPFLASLSNYLLLSLAPWRTEVEADNWHQSRGGTKARELVETAPVHPD